MKKFFEPAEKLMEKVYEEEMTKEEALAYWRSFYDTIDNDCSRDFEYDNPENRKIVEELNFWVKDYIINLD